MAYNRMTTGKAAQIIGVSSQAIRDWIDAGQFPTAYKVGDRWALTPEEVQKMNEDYHRPREEFEEEVE